jgi:hypothetical protein
MLCIFAMYFYSKFHIPSYNESLLTPLNRKLNHIFPVPPYCNFHVTNVLP